MTRSDFRLRRVRDTRRWFVRRVQYEIEFPGSDGRSTRVVTGTPGRVLAPLIGSHHPADLATYTHEADLAWDGGIGPWRAAPGEVVDQS